MFVAHGILALTLEEEEEDDDKAQNKKSTNDLVGVKRAPRRNFPPNS